jgi:hypothetical protein
MHTYSAWTYGGLVLDSTRPVGTEFRLGGVGDEVLGQRLGARLVRASATARKASGLTLGAGGDTERRGSEEREGKEVSGNHVERLSEIGKCGSVREGCRNRRGT